MVKSLTLKNFTVFEEAEFEFGGLNVVVGENGTGKSHLLKMIYALSAASARSDRGGNGAPATAVGLSRSLVEKLSGVFRPAKLGELVSAGHGSSWCEVRLGFGEPAYDLWIQFARQSQEDIELSRGPTSFLAKSPVFLPPGELLSIFPGFVTVFEEYRLEFDETLRDACVLLGGFPVRGPREERAKALAAPLLEAMRGGRLLKVNERFYLDLPAEGARFEMHLVAEGWRKLAMLVQLILNGALLDEGHLFWDEPEANLNPALIKHVAKAILDLSASGVQIWLATHSLFLMREIDLLLSEAGDSAPRTRFFGLHREGSGVTVQQGDTVEDIGPISALDEAVEQSDRYLRRR